MSNCFANPYMFFITATPYVDRPNGSEYKIYGLLTQNNSDIVILDNASGELIYNIAMCGFHNMLTNNDSTDTMAINVSSDAALNGTQMVIKGGSMTVINAMR